MRNIIGQWTDKKQETIDNFPILFSYNREKEYFCTAMLLKKYKWLVMSGDYQLIVVIGYELASYLLFYSSARCVTVKELFICKNSIFIGDTKINPLFLFFLPPDNFTVKAVWSVGTPSPCRSSTTVFRLPHKRRKGLHVTPKPCLDWWHKSISFVLMPRDAFTGISVCFLF